MDCLQMPQLNDRTGCSLCDVSPDLIFTANAVEFNIPSFGYWDNNAILSDNIIKM
jgi:hypothetical protein